MQDEVENARNLLYEVLNIAEMPCLLKATAYSVLGESYIFTNVEKSIHYFKISLQELHKITNSKSLLKRKLVENTLAFCCIIRKIPVKSSYIHDIAEQALLKIFLNEHDARLKCYTKLRIVQLFKIYI